MNPRGLLLFALLPLLIAGAPPLSSAQQQHPANETIPALLLSDVHFDPLHDPARAKRLNEAPVSQWAAILSAPDAANQPQAFASLQKTCHARGVDTPYTLLRSSIDAMRRHAANAQFVTISGDLLVHDLPCRYQTLLPGSPHASYEAFVEKTLQFVVRQIADAFPRVPLYIAPGNNDSGCGDYHFDPNSAFLQKTGQIVAAAAPRRSRRSVADQFSTGGYYSIPLAPLRNTRLIVLNDVLLSPQYATCKGQRDPAPATAELDWLAHQLDSARAAGNRVWLMGHIPPGINAFDTVRHFRNLCSGDSPDTFLLPGDSSRLDTILQHHADTIRLALFGHTHMDEVQLIPANNNLPAAQSIPVKLVPSISPVNGNQPSFTIAQVEPDGTLKDYSVVVASNLTGIATTWSQEYDYADTYHVPDFSAASVTRLIDAFRSDPKAQQPDSRHYIEHYFKGKMAAALAPFWTQYECSLDNPTPETYSHCVCAQQK